MFKFVRIVFIASVATLFISASAASGDNPVALLIEAKGEVMYSPDGKAWKKVSRNKFLFENWQARTGRNGTCILLNQETDEIEQVGNNTEFEIHANGTKFLKGTASEPEPAKSLAGFFKRKFATVQKYTGLTRYGKTENQVKLKTADRITLSDDYPEMVWKNVGEEYSYQLIVGEKIFNVPKPGTESEMIRFKLPHKEMKPGLFEYCVQILYEEEILYSPEKKNKLKWLSDAEKISFQTQKQQISQIARDNGFLMGALMDEHGLKVAAMDQYRKFLAENPDSDETRAFLIKILNDLKLEKFENAEKAVYNGREIKCRK